MTHITPKTCNIITNEKQKKTKIPNALKYYFVISQVFFGYDYGFTPVLKTGLRAPLRLFVLLIISFHLLMLISPIPSYYNELSAWSPVAEYLMYICALGSTKYNLYNYIRDVKNHINIRSQDRFFFLLTSLINVIIVHAIKCLVTIAFRVINKGAFFNQHFSVNFNWCYYFFYGFPRIGADTVALCQMVIFYYAYAYIRDIKDQLLPSEVDINRVAQRFVNLADVYDKIRPLQNKLVSHVFFL